MFSRGYIRLYRWSQWRRTDPESSGPHPWRSGSWRTPAESRCRTERWRRGWWWLTKALWRSRPSKFPGTRTASRVFAVSRWKADEPRQLCNPQTVGNGQSFPGYEHRQQLSCKDCLQDERKDNQNSSVLYCVIAYHRRSQGVQWVHQGGKIFRRNLQGKFVGKFVSTPSAHQVHSQTEQESIFRTFFCSGWGDLRWKWFVLVVLDRVLRATTKKGRQLFEEKCTPDKILATPTLRTAIVHRHK